MEKTSSNTHSSSSSFGNLVDEFLLFMGILKWVILSIHNFYSLFQFFLQFDVLDKSKGRLELENNNPSSEPLNSLNLIRRTKEITVDDGKLGREDVESVMENLKLFCDPDSERLQERLGKEEISILFEDKEPSLEEVKQAFDVFDVNRDGFVDATELQRVLGVLGFQEESEIENCKSMIRAFDENGDGKIDFSEFVKLMERSFC